MPKEPLTDEEQRILIDSARKMGEFRYTPGSRPIDAEKTVLFFLHTGAHPSVLADAKAGLHVERRGEKAWVVWNRPKKSGHEALTRVPASSKIAPWIDGFVKADRPRFRQLYNALLASLSNEKYPGLSMKNLSPLALRHTFGVNLIRRGVPDRTVQQLMNCDEKTLRFYAKFREEQIEEQLEEIGW